MKRLCGAMGCVGAFVFAHAADAGLIQVLSSERLVRASATANDKSDFQEFYGPETGAWSQKAKATVFNGPLISGADADQNSTIGDSTISGSFSASAGASGIGTVTMLGLSRLVVQFQLDEQVSFISTSTAAAIGFTYKLDGPGGNIFNDFRDSSRSGQLSPGVYTLTVAIGSTQKNIAGSMNTSFSVTSVPAPGGLAVLGMTGALAGRRRRRQ